MKMVEAWFSTKRIYLLALGATLFYWFLETFMDAYVFDGGGFIKNFVYITPDETWMRLVIISAFFSTAFFVRWLVEQIIKREEIISKNAENFRRFAHSIVHDLKSPAVAQAGLAKRLKRKYGSELDEEGSAVCDAIIRSAETSADLIRMVNEYMEAKEIPLKIERVDVGEVFRIIRDEFSSKMNAGKVRLILPKDPIIIRKTDRMSLVRLFRNLVDNALKYGGDSLSEIRIDYKKAIDHHIFSVSDNGVGVNSDDPDKMFLIFERCNNSEGIAGSGIGLATVKEIAELHGGDAWFEPDFPNGTKINVSLSRYF